MSGGAHCNAELVSFFKNHDQAVKLTAEELQYVESLLFSHSSPRQKHQPAFPRITPLAANRLALSSPRVPPASAPNFKTSRKQLEVVDMDDGPREAPHATPNRQFEFSFGLGASGQAADRVMETTADPLRANVPSLDTERTAVEDNSKEKLSDTQRPMTEAAKQLMASILMDDSNLPVATLSRDAIDPAPRQPSEWSARASPHVAASSHAPTASAKSSSEQPAHASTLSTKLLSEQSVRVPTAPTKLPSDQAPLEQYKFQFDLSGFGNETASTPNKSLPSFDFVI